jgi:FkbM family methyltransferase
MFFARLYARFYIFMHQSFGLTPRGLGFLLRRLSQDAVLVVQGRKVYFDARVSSSYARLIAGRWNEEETHTFLHGLARRLEKITFIDVGANIGEMAVDFASLPAFRQIFAFEPDPICARVIEINALLNQQTNVTVFPVAVADKKGQMFLSGAGSPQASLAAGRQGPDDLKVDVVRLDEVFQKSGPVPDENTQLVLLIDVEGAELNVLRGAKKMLKNHRPLVIFEYNHVSRAYFNLKQVQDILGTDYTIHRLNQQGRLDTNLDKTWNCVAVPKHLNFIAESG